MSDFVTRAQAHLKDFTSLPAPIHPLWKGFPLKQWQQALEKRQWTHSYSYRPSDSLKPGLPFSLDGLNVLSVKGSQWAWTQTADDASLLEKSLKIEACEGCDLGSGQKDSFRDLSRAKALPGLRIKLSAGFEVAAPVLILFGSSGLSEWNTFVHEIEVGERSQLKMIFLNVGEAQTGSLTTHFVKSKLNREARFSAAHLSGVEKVENSFVRFEFDLQNDSTLEFVDLGNSVELGRAEVHVSLRAPGAYAIVSGIHLLNGSDVYDARVRMAHESADTFSEQNFKCVVSDRAQSLFGGNIIIQKDAQRVSSSQSHKALLISRGARAAAFPELEIHADDVKAGHGSSTGQMDKDQIFYLKSRGLSEAAAVHLLSEAFVKDVVLKVSDSRMRRVLEEILDRILPDFVKGMESKWQIQ